MKNKYDVKVTDEWAEDFAKRSGMSKKKAKFLLRVVVGWDNFLFAVSKLRKKPKPSLNDLLAKTDQKNPHSEQLPDEQGKEGEKG